MGRTIRIGVWTVCLGVLCACATVTHEQVQTYTNAYEDFRQVAVMIYEDSLLREKQHAPLPPQPATYEEIIKTVPSTLGPRAPRPKFEVNTERCLAGIEAGRMYNEALLALASGESVGQVRKSAHRLMLVFSTLSPEAAVLDQAVSSAMGQIERARTQEEVRAALLQTVTVEGKTGHPVDLLLATLHEDAVSLYESRVTQFDDDTITLMNDPVAVRRHADEILQYHATLQAYQELIVKTREYFAALQLLASQPNVPETISNFIDLGIEVSTQARSIKAGIR